MTVVMLELSQRRNAKAIVDNLLRDGNSHGFQQLDDIVGNWIISNKPPHFRYHIPRSWLNPSQNFLVVFEEWGGDATGMSLVKRTR